MDSLRSGENSIKGTFFIPAWVYRKIIYIQLNEKCSEIFWIDAYGNMVAMFLVSFCIKLPQTLLRATVVHLNFRAGSPFPVPVCTVPSSMDRTSRCNKVDEVRLYASYRFNLFLIKGQRCVLWEDEKGDRKMRRMIKVF